MNLPIPTYPEGEYRAYNSSGVEREVGDFLYGMVRILKPEQVLETGTAKGISSVYIAQGLKDNGKGILQTIEFDENHWDEAKALWKQMGVEKYILLKESRVEHVVITGQVDMLFLDSEPEFRFNELVRFYPYLNPGGYAFIHDLPQGWCEGNVNTDHPDFKNWPFGEVPSEIKNWLKNGDLVKFHFHNPREMTGFYKPQKEDYKP